MIDQKRVKINQDSKPFYQIILQGMLRNQSKGDIDAWELQQSSFENLQTSLVQKGFQIELKNFTHSDYIYFKLDDYLTEDTVQSETVRLSFCDLFRYSQNGRIVWIPIQIG